MSSSKSRTDAAVSVKSFPWYSSWSELNKLKKMLVFYRQFTSRFKWVPAFSHISPIYRTNKLQHIQDTSSPYSLTLYQVNSNVYMIWFRQIDNQSQYLWKGVFCPIYRDQNWRPIRLDDPRETYDLFCHCNHRFEFRIRNQSGGYGPHAQILLIIHRLSWHRQMIWKR